MSMSKVILVVFLIALSGAFFCLFFGYSYYQEHFLPGTLVEQIEIGGLTFQEAMGELGSGQINPDLTISLSASESSVVIKAEQLKLKFDFERTLRAVREEQRQLPGWYFLGRLIRRPQVNYQMYLDCAQEELKSLIEELAEQVDDPGEVASIEERDGELVVEKGRDSFYLDREKTQALMMSELPKQASLVAVTGSETLALTEAQVELIWEKVREMEDKELVLTSGLIDNYEVRLGSSELVGVEAPLELIRTKTMADLYEQIAGEATRSAQEPKLVIEKKNGKLEVGEFVSPRDGLGIEREVFEGFLSKRVRELMATDEGEVVAELPLASDSPAMSLVETNDLGIAEEIGFGESYYAHSIPGRIHNVALTASRINKTLVAPGEEFSFNETLGEVSNKTGFQEGYVIQGGRSVLSDGGGVCQVSTTLFRALLDAGLKITRRLPHSYRVTYYELDNDPGFDATVYSGNIDLRFINDTENYVLISSEADSKKLYMTMRIWGTSDGRYTQVSDYKQFNYRSPPPPEYIADDSLAPGQTKQIDWAVGGLQTVFTHTIYNADGSERSKINYSSNYQAWSNKYLVGPGQ
jgi:vancomycin resistance protein YoaR